MRGIVLFLAFGFWITAPLAATAQVALCDELAASPDDKNRPAGVMVVDPDKIDAARAIPACRQALAERPNDPRITFQLGQALSQTQEDYTEVARLYQSAADQGYAPAQSSLGDMYRLSRGVEQDYAQVIHWNELAARQGYVPAQNKLGDMYAYGREVEQDDAQAIYWYELAAEQGDATVQYDLGNKYNDFEHGLMWDDRRAIYWYERAAKQGHVEAQYKLGRLHYYDSDDREHDTEIQYWSDPGASDPAAEEGDADELFAYGPKYATLNKLWQFDVLRPSSSER